MVIPAMQLAGKIPDVHVQLWASALLKGLIDCTVVESSVCVACIADFILSFCLFVHVVSRRLLLLPVLVTAFNGFSQNFSLV